MDNNIWHNYLKEACKKRITSRTFAAFNTNVDVVVHVTGEKLKKVLTKNSNLDFTKIRKKDIKEINTVQSQEDFFAVFRDSLIKGKSFHIVVESTELMNFLVNEFSDEKEIMGGQAGIIANQMASLETESVVYTPLLTSKQAELFTKGVTTPLVKENKLSLVNVKEAVQTDIVTKINWVFEYAKGEKIDFAGEEIITPRANRLILASRPKGAVMSFRGKLTNHLQQLGAKIDVAFMAGYHYVAPENPDGSSYTQFMERALRQLKEMRAGNSKLKIHFEYVPMKYKSLEKKSLLALASEIDSFGINENEIRRVLNEFGFKNELHNIELTENAYTLYQGALKLSQTLKIKRIQLHNLGYYVLILRKPYEVKPKEVRQACLFASAVNAMKAKYGGYVNLEQLKEAATTPLSEIGLSQLRIFANRVFKQKADQTKFIEEGIWEFADHYLLVVPTHIISNPVSTVGMGDTISSSSYAVELSKKLIPSI